MYAGAASMAGTALALSGINQGQGEDKQWKSRTCHDYVLPSLVIR